MKYAIIAQDQGYITHVYVAPTMVHAELIVKAHIKSAGYEYKHEMNNRWITDDGAEVEIKPISRTIDLTPSIIDWTSGVVVSDTDLDYMIEHGDIPNEIVTIPHHIDPLTREQYYLAGPVTLPEIADYRTKMGY